MKKTRIEDQLEYTSTLGGILLVVFSFVILNSIALQFFSTTLLWVMHSIEAFILGYGIKETLLSQAMLIKEQDRLQAGEPENVTSLWEDDLSSLTGEDA